MDEEHAELCRLVAIMDGLETELEQARVAAGLDPNPVHPAIDRHLADIGLDRLPA